MNLYLLIHPMKWLLMPCLAVFLLTAAGCGKPKPSQTSGELFQNLSLDQALVKAHEDEKIVVIYLYKKNSVLCHRIETFTFKNSKVQSWLRNQSVAIKIDPMKDDDLRERYRIGQVPTLLFLRANGTEVGRLIGNIMPKDFIKKTSSFTDDKNPSSK